MRRFVHMAILWGASSGICLGARCTTVLHEPALTEYGRYVAKAESSMASRFESGELAWVRDGERARAAAELDSGKLVRRDVSSPGFNERLATYDGTVLHWVGAIRIPGASPGEVQAVLLDHNRYDAAYRPMIFNWRARQTSSLDGPSYEVVFGLQNSYRFASVFLQHYAFRVRGRMDFTPATERLYAHLRSAEIRESDSGEPGKEDFLEPYHDHGIMWAINAYWRARKSGSGVYMEFETITLARSVQGFACTVGIIPVPKAVVSAAMAALPVQSVELMLTSTKAEWKRRNSKRPDRGAGQ